MTTQRRISYEDFVLDPKTTFESLDRGEEDEVLVEMAGRQYRLEAVKPLSKTGIWKDYDPKRTLQAFRDAQGIFDGLDIEQFKQEIKAARGQDSIGRPGD